MAIQFELLLTLSTSASGTHQTSASIPSSFFAHQFKKFNSRPTVPSFLFWIIELWAISNFMVDSGLSKSFS